MASHQRSTVRYPNLLLLLAFDANDTNIESIANSYGQSLLRSLSIAQLIITAILGCMLVSSPLYGQSESTLKKFFDRKTVVVRIDMPGSHHGVDVYPRTAKSIDWEEYRSELKEYGTALPVRLQREWDMLASRLRES